MKPLKYPNEACDYLNETWSLTGTIKYAINWKKGRHVKSNVAPLLEQWVAEAAQSPTIRLIIEQLGNTAGNKSFDTRAHRCLRWVHQNITYKRDSDTWKTPEYWQSPLETIKLHTGDCEDGAILMYALCRLSGIPANRMLLMCGDVEGGGHCWLAYRSEYNPVQLKFLDWCYWYDPATIGYRKNYVVIDTKINGDSKYKKMWFAFTEDQSFYKLHVLDSRK